MIRLAAWIAGTKSLSAVTGSAISSLPLAVDSTSLLAKQASAHRFDVQPEMSVSRHGPNAVVKVEAIDKHANAHAALPPG